MAARLGFIDGSLQSVQHCPTNQEAAPFVNPSTYSVSKQNEHNDTIADQTGTKTSTATTTTTTVAIQSQRGIIHNASAFAFGAAKDAAAKASYECC